jgi:hypothetical protein
MPLAAIAHTDSWLVDFNHGLCPHAMPSPASGLGIDCKGHCGPSSAWLRGFPGSFRGALRLDDVALVRADETVFNAMDDGWRAQMLASGLAD